MDLQFSTVNSKSGYIIHVWLNISLLLDMKGSGIKKRLSEETYPQIRL